MNHMKYCLNWPMKMAQVPIFGIVVSVPEVKIHYPSNPPPKEASLAIYDEQFDLGNFIRTHI